ncbi:putative high-light inducible protein [Cyanophage S-RIM44]|uniref:High light inducible protein n=2 Tax=Vellamovirus TaxID=2733139 RepID=E3SPU1_9CAUD|nr:high light inducible protein [Prochlorococcus phage Syn1]YP_009783344.1 high light inducible protein [Cyanophage S-RIM44]ADO99307.1 high light inducible protein [Prochlorococcus phage Syn1]AMO43447.1 putative high-light inducible protein [Cyanophage S-RIM44]AOO11688.1 putative high-light inducible protein [Cyanophage S-RIM44]AOO11919.1 putative high-light inducible protein [Cyanophage S-RIM44]AOO12154.1 putative high-light inducible protein [Cyanophage S-RIM44]
MTVTTNEQGQQNLFAKEPSMYMTKEDLDRYGIEPYAEKAEKANGRWAMLGIIAGAVSYAITGKLFFGII